MSDESELDLDTQESNEDIISRKDKRLKTLSDKVKEKEDALAKEAEERAKLQAERDSVSKERDFFKGFSQVSTKYQGASEYQDKIWEKVKSGYDVEDATVAILNKEGKLTPNQPKVDRERAAGGSATTNMKGGESKAPHEMTQAERHAALKELEAAGELNLNR